MILSGTFNDSYGISFRNIELTKTNDKFENDAPIISSNKWHIKFDVKLTNNAPFSTATGHRCALILYDSSNKEVQRVYTTASQFKLATWKNVGKTSWVTYETDFIFGYTEPAYYLEIFWTANSSLSQTNCIYSRLIIGKYNTSLRLMGGGNTDKSSPSHWTDMTYSAIYEIEYLDYKLIDFKAYAYDVDTTYVTPYYGIGAEATIEYKKTYSQSSEPSIEIQVNEGEKSDVGSTEWEKEIFGYTYNGIWNPAPENYDEDEEWEWSIPEEAIIRYKIARKTDSGYWDICRVRIVASFLNGSQEISRTILLNPAAKINLHLAGDNRGGIAMGKEYEKPDESKPVWERKSWSQLTESYEPHLQIAYPTYIKHGVNGLTSFSTEERKIGKWIDGRPIYAKTFINSNVTGNNGSSYTRTNAVTQATLKSMNVKAIVRIMGKQKMSSGAEYVLPAFYSSNRWKSYLYDSSYGVVLRHRDQTTDPFDLYTTIWYTKSTDNKTSSSDYYNFDAFKIAD